MTSSLTTFLLVVSSMPNICMEIELRKVAFKAFYVLGATDAFLAQIQGKNQLDLLKYCVNSSTMLPVFQKKSLIRKFLIRKYGAKGQNLKQILRK